MYTLVVCVLRPSVAVPTPLRALCLVLPCCSSSALLPAVSVVCVFDCAFLCVLFHTVLRPSPLTVTYPRARQGLFTSVELCGASPSFLLSTAETAPGSCNSLSVGAAHTCYCPHWTALSIPLTSPSWPLRVSEGDLVVLVEEHALPQDQSGASLFLT